MSSIENRVNKVISEQLGVATEEILPHSKLIDDLGADSLDTVELIMGFEEAFDIDIPDDVAEKITTVQDAIDLIAHKETACAV